MCKKKEPVTTRNVKNTKLRTHSQSTVFISFSYTSNDFSMNPGRMPLQIISSISPRGTEGKDVFTVKV